MTSGVGSILSADELLARSQAAVASRSSTTGGSKIQQMLAAREDGGADTVSLSPVARLLQSKQTEAAKTSTPYTEQDWFLNAKVAQLKGQIQLYSSVPGLDPSGAVMQSLEKEVVALVTKQQDKLKASQAEAAKKQAELDRLEAERKAAPTSADALLERAKLRSEGKSIPVEVSSDVQKLLDNVKGQVVNKTT